MNTADAKQPPLPTCLESFSSKAKLETARMCAKRLDKFLFGKTASSLVLVLLSCADANAATIFADGNFANPEWNQTVYTVGAGGAQTASLRTSGGNSGSYLYIDDTVNPGSFAAPSQVWGTFFKNSAVYDPSVSGAVQTLDYAEDAIMYVGGGQGQASVLAIQQNGKVYLQFPYFTTNYSQWTHLSRTGMTANDFKLVDTSTLFDGNTSLHPDFSSSGAAMTFGFARANSTRVNGYTVIGGIDNWQVTLNPGQSVPEPGTPLLFGSAIAGLVVTRFRKIQRRP